MTGWSRHRFFTRPSMLYEIYREAKSGHKTTEQCNSGLLPSSNFSHVSVILVLCGKGERRLQRLPGTPRQLFQVQSHFQTDERSCSSFAHRRRAKSTKQ